MLISTWDNSLKEQSGKYFALRVGFREIKGMRQQKVDILVDRRGEGYKTFTALRDAGIGIAILERLADADTFRSMGIDRRKALWEVSALQDMPVEIFKVQPLMVEDV